MSNPISWRPVACRNERDSPCCCSELDALKTHGRPYLNESFSIILMLIHLEMIRSSNKSFWGGNTDSHFDTPPLPSRHPNKVPRRCCNPCWTVWCGVRATRWRGNDECLGKGGFKMMLILLLWCPRWTCSKPCTTFQYLEDFIYENSSFRRY